MDSKKNVRLLRAIDRYIKEEYLPPTKKDYYELDRTMFAFHSYKCWAAKEAWKFLNNHCDKPILDCLEDFRNMMGDYACETRNPDANFAFSIGYDVGTDILDFVIGYE